MGCSLQVGELHFNEEWWLSGVGSGESGKILEKVKGEVQIGKLLVSSRDALHSVLTAKSLYVLEFANIAFLQQCHQERAKGVYVS